MRDRVVDKLGSEGRRSGKTIRNESLGEGGSCLEMKLSPQVCHSETISGRVFSLSYKWQHTVQLGSGEAEQEHMQASMI